MFSLKNITKIYGTGDSAVRALKGVSLDFRKSEFVSILGPSGCGKTTLLNIIGGLDQYTDGDLIINGRSTKEYRDRDWDAYRNHSIGFVFQSYNLIPHQTVLQNVELALTLSGVSKAERRARAKDALVQVGLGDQLNKKPSEMSGGQMQRVAIARALVNNPDIILADEPTGALDTETSVQVMEILKKISSERLIIMVTHNPELAEQYSSRIIRMLDGEILSDTAPLTEEETKAEEERIQALLAKPAVKKEKKPSMSFGTSFMLSLKNLFTKKGRTILTSFAGSIGIIGIALILAVSQGMTTYINHVQETTLSSYPITLEATTVDLTALMESFMNVGKGDVNHDKDAVYKDPMIGELVNALSKLEENKNDLTAFKAFLEKEMLREDSTIKDAISGVQYAYDLDLPIYTKNQDGKIIKSDTGELMQEMLAEFMIQLTTGKNTEDRESMSQSSMGSPMMGSMMQMKMWQELLSGPKDASGNRPLINDLLKEQYEVVHGTWPTNKNEIVLVLNENNELDDLTLYALGLLHEKDIDAIIDAAVAGEELSLEGIKNRWTYEEICNQTFKTILPYDLYKDKNGDGVFEEITVDNLQHLADFTTLYDNALELRVVGIIRPSEDTENAMLTGAIGYTYELTDYAITMAQKADVVKAQLASPTVDVLTGLPFKSVTEKMTDEEKKAAFIAYVKELDEKQKAEAFIKLQTLNAIEQTLNSIHSTDEFIAFLTQMSEHVDFEEMANTSMEQIIALIKERDVNEVKVLFRPYLKNGITERIEKQFEDIPDSFLASMLDQALAAEGEQAFTLAQFGTYYDEITEFAPTTYDETLVAIGCLDLEAPAAINIYASSFENKDLIVDMIASYNNSVDETKQIAYTDYLGIMMSSITTIINAISYVLIAFVSISLIVSSIMIGVITLISVQERTKEIGILRAIGASKKDVSSMFNAETMIIGFASGLLGVVVTYLLCIPINLILHALTGIPNLNAILPFGAAIILVTISVLLTLISGLIPSRSAAKKDPVVALRSE